MCCESSRSRHSARRYVASYSRLAEFGRTGSSGPGVNYVGWLAEIARQFVESCANHGKVALIGKKLGVRWVTMARAEERWQCKPMLHWCVFQPVRKLGSRSRVLLSGDASFCSQKRNDPV
jgi:hypothetical protein